MRTKLAGAALISVLVIASISGSAGASSAPAVDKSDNVKLVTSIPYEGGSDIAFQGKYVYFGQLGDKGGVRVLDASGKKPKEIAFISCPGSQNDVAVVRPGLLALGYHSGSCSGGPPGAGVRLIDVRNPNKPRFLSQVELPGGAHTLTVYPGTDIIYASPGGLANGGGTEQILDASNPDKLKIAATFKPSQIGCHDITFARAADGDTMLGFCAGGGEVSIWDVTDELAPVVIAHGFTPSFFPHAAVPTPDGEYLVMTDEAFVAHDCIGGPTGSVWVFDIRIPQAPIMVGHWGPQRGAAPVGTIASEWCTAHNLNFVGKTRQAVISWYTGGTSVVDFSNPTLPQEVAYFRADNSDSWSSYFFDGLIYVNDLIRGIDVLKVKGLKTK
ncbi:MAG: LVIVD repeat-containing protein [Actinomycetota bacterium]